MNRLLPLIMLLLLALCAVLVGCSSTNPITTELSDEMTLQERDNAPIFQKPDDGMFADE